VSDDVHLLAYSAALAWLMIMTAAGLRTRWWTRRGFGVAVGNRDDVPAPSAATGRADRAARNMLENLLLLAVLVVAARLAGVAPARIARGARVFFWARVLYFPVYVAGIRYLRTALWAVGVVGLGMIFVELL
jgi:uncharacterized MAPEG superfamily protein